VAVFKAGPVIADKHPLQEARLNALRAYDVLDTPREADFDELVELASSICGTPISVVNLIDSDRQWFKAEVGLGVRETPLDTSICSHAILQSEFVEIEDTRLDPRMLDNDLCTADPGLRFYAGALLQTRDGLPLGTLCVLDYQPRTLTAVQRRSLQIIAKQVMMQLDLRLALKNQAMLMHEIDHRVKNSLQSVSSLVQIQRRQSTEQSVRDALDDVTQRLRTISLVHEELYHASTSSTVDIGHYLDRLGGLLGANTPANVTVAVDAQSYFADSKYASSIGIIVSEFVANSLKHAFPKDRVGAIRITFRPLSPDRFELVCEDDGIGAAGKAAKDAAIGMGTRIINACAAQIGAEIERKAPASGTYLRLTIPA
jgi:two-component sensor histidine kinase